MEKPPKIPATECAALQMLVNPTGYMIEAHYSCIGCGSECWQTLVSGKDDTTKVRVLPLDNCDYITAVIKQP